MISEGSVHGYLVPCFWFHCEIEIMAERIHGEGWCSSYGRQELENEEGNWDQV
jgi:hypothetical protein